MYAKIIVPLPLPPLTYKIPESLDIKVGAAVKVAVRRKIYDGIVVRLSAEREKGDFEIKDISGPSLDFPCIDPKTVEMLLWIADYYHYPAGEVLNAFLPPNPTPLTSRRYHIASGGAPIRGTRQLSILEKARNQGGVLREIAPEDRAAVRALVKKGALSTKDVEDVEVRVETLSRSVPPELLPEQASAFAAISTSMDGGRFECFLLEGVTGSGKTEVYLRAAERAVQRGRSTLVVVPEISLTPQLVDRFRRRIGAPIAVLHSGLSDSERSRQWHLLNRGHLRVCVGARSAVLAPIRDLGLIVVDEEHESALKQEDRLRYQARDLSVLRAKMASCPVVLGSATPSLESFYHARTGKYHHLSLHRRATGGTLPEVLVVDLAKQRKSEGSIGHELTRSINEALSKSEQVMLLLNRRGFSSFLLCQSCGHVPECPNCSVSLTHYRAAQALKCHYCGFKTSLPAHCAKCDASTWELGTEGTEALEEEVRRRFPSARTIRIDRESMERRGAMERALEAIAGGKVDIVIGTQIIAKGHDFPNISVVGVVHADTSFHLPDFRASEKSFQLFTQMAGRAGRGAIPGKVILQTYNPRHPSILHTINHDFRGFAEEELRIRSDFFYPPFSRLARILVTAPSSPLAERQAERIVERLTPAAQQMGIEIIGPAPAVLAKLQNKYRWHVILKGKRAQDLQRLLHSVTQVLAGKLDSKTTLQVDVDPVSLM